MLQRLRKRKYVRPGGTAAITRCHCRLAEGNPRTMLTLIRREFLVDIPLQRAWDHLARIENWPRRAPQFRQIEVHPPGEVGPESTGIIYLTNGIKPVFQVTEFNPPVNWKWVGA